MNLIINYFANRTKSKKAKCPSVSKEANSKLLQKHEGNIQSVKPATSLPNGIVVKETHAVRATRDFFEMYNLHDAEKLAGTMSPKFLVTFAEAEILGSALIEDSKRLWRSFPDVTITYEAIIDISPGVARMVNLRSAATHTGAPYGFGPYPEVQATGCKVLNDPEEATITINETTGLIDKIEIVAKGRLSGPPGYYEQIGGILF